MKNDELLEFNLEISASDATQEELDNAARQLLVELKETDVESANLTDGGPAETGSKPGEVITIGSIAIAVLPAVLPKVVEAIQAWMTRNSTVKFKGKIAGQDIDFEGSPENLQKLIKSLSKKKTKKSKK